MPKVSIIVPVYNTSKYLNACINSLINQTLKDIEIIIINDGSKDNSKEIIKSYNDKRIIFIDKENEGIGKTRNLGIKKSKGEFLMFIDSDDYIEPNCAQIMYNNAIFNKADLVIANYYADYLDHINKIKFKDFGVTNLKETPNLLIDINLGPCNKLYKRDLLINNNILFEEKIKYEDAPFVCKSLFNANKISKEESYLTHYVIHEKSETTTYDERIFDIIKIAKIIYEDLKSYEYLHDSLTSLMCSILTDYCVQLRNIKNKNLQKSFLEEVYSFLKNVDKEFKHCEFMNRLPFIERLIKSNKINVWIYLKLYHFIY